MEHTLDVGTTKADTPGMATTQTKAIASYTKLQTGAWGIKSSTPAPTGGTVVVTKRSGEAKRETIGTLVYTGADRYSDATVWVYTIATTACATTTVTSQKPTPADIITDQMLSRYTKYVKLAYYPEKTYKGIRPRNERADYHAEGAALLAEWGEDVFEEAGEVYSARCYAASEAAEAWRTDQY